MDKKTWKRLLGYEPSREQKEYILNMVQSEKISIQEATSRMALPPIFLEGQPRPDYDNPFRPAILIRRRKESDNLKNIK